MTVTVKTRKAVIERDRSICQWCGRYCDTTGDYSLQHRRARGMGGSKRPETDLPGNLVLVHGSGTTGCHGAIESQRAEAVRRGFNVPQHLTPAKVPLLVHSGPAGRWVRFDDDGNDPETIPAGDAIEYMVLVGLHEIGLVT